MKVKTIIRHPAPAHRDDHLATCLALAWHPEAEVLCTEPTSAQLLDPEVLVLDCGREFNPQLLNFDHHQEQGLPCVLHLLLGYHDLLAVAEAAMPWLVLVDKQDRKGVRAVAEDYNLTTKETYAIKGQVEPWTIDWCVKHPVDAKPLMRAMGEKLLREIEVGKSQRLFWEKAKCRLTKKNFVTYDLRGQNLAPLPTAAMQPEELPKAQLMVGIDPRSGNESLVSVHDNGGPDLSGFKNDERVMFAHPSGFLVILKKGVDALEFACE